MPRLSPYNTHDPWLFTAHNRRRRHPAFTHNIPHPMARGKEDQSHLPPRRFVHYFLDPKECMEHYMISHYEDLKVCTSQLTSPLLIRLDEIFNEYFNGDSKYRFRSPSEFLKDGSSYILMPLAFDKRGNSKIDFGPPLVFRYLSAILGDIEHKPTLRHYFAPLLDSLQKMGLCNTPSSITRE